MGSKQDKKDTNVMSIKVIDDIQILVPTFIGTFNKEPWNEHWTAETAKKAL
ncbi:MAG: hypothetical protein GX221_06945 [Candidatus Riflebacteria bacterium]|nr:hypothetical protein [Candidatus Riflebacteria bacterium]